MKINIKQKKSKILMAVILVVVFMACSKGLLDKKPLNGISDADLWGDPNLVITFINQRYDQIGHGWPESWMSSVVDETSMTWSRGTEPVTQGYLSPSDLGRMNGGYYGFDNRAWSVVWANIKDCNLFFSKIDQVPFQNADSVLKKRFTGEVTFVRALEYFDLVSKWGAMPIITKAYDLTNLDEGSKLPRNTYKECVDFIVSECDKAASLLPPNFSGNNYGRATSVAALALKARMLLYAASPLMNKSGVDALVGYPAPDNNRWQKVADADKTVIDLALASGYKLYDESPGDIKQRYTDMFLDKQNPEVLFARQNYGNTNNAEYIDQANGPNGYDEWGGNTPIEEFADAFDMIDGSKFNWNNPAMAAHPFDNRDPRLHAFVLTDGDIWKGRPVETHFNETAPGVFRGGLDTKDGGSPWNTSKTGINMRKFLNPDYVTNSWVFTGKSAQNWVWLRLGEFYLDLAEAEYNLGNEAEARKALNVIRTRAGMPDVIESGTALWNRIVNERRIELSFEEHRYFDIRRWMIADDVMNKPATGVIVTKYLNGTTVYKAHASDNSTLVEDRKFVAPKMYWLPIPQSEIDKNASLQQNPGY